MLFQFTPEDVVKARGTNALADMDTITSPHGGHLVVVAQSRDSSGMLEYVCWACTEPFEPENRDLAGVEKISPGGTVPVLLHRRCAGPRKIMSIGDVSKGLQIRRAVAKGFQFASTLAKKLAT